MRDEKAWKWLNENELSYHVWDSKYRYQNESWDDFINRIITSFTIPEDPIYNQNLSKYVADLTIIPGGSVLSSVGTNKLASLSNCFVLSSPEDSITSILNTARDIAQVFKRRGGVGIDISNLRPNGAFVNNSAKTTTGPVSFMELYSQVTNTIGQAGRRGALMLSINIDHPDSIEFIKAKQDLSKITGANISVRISDKFMEAVKLNKSYILRFPCDMEIDYSEDITKMEYNTLYQYKEGYIKIIKAKDVWDEIIHCAWNTAEPGVLFWDKILKNDPASYYSKFRAISTNPCGEIPLGPSDSCRLIAINLYNCVKFPFTTNAYIDYEMLYNVAYTAQMMGDKLVDLEAQKVEKLISNTEGDEQKLWKAVLDIGLSGRRTGIGFTGYADALAAINASYGDVVVTEKIMKTIYKAELQASINLAKKNGPFPDYDKEIEFSESNNYNKWIKLEFPDLYEDMKNFGRRNISWSTCPPAGSISLLTQTSSGIEPQFLLYYNRRRKCNPGEKGDFIDSNGVSFITYNVIAQSFIEWMKINGYYKENLSIKELDSLYIKSPWYKQCAQDIDPRIRVKTQGLIQKYITHSISSTCNLPTETTENDISVIYLDAYNSNCKGITCYRDKCRDGILISSSESSNQNSPKQEVSPKFNYIEPVSRKKMGVTYGATFCKKCACGTLYISCNRDRDGNLVEVFTHTSKGGICQANLNAETRMASLALRSGVKVSEVIDQLKGITCPACTTVKAKGGHVDGISCADIIAKTIQEFQNSDVCIQGNTSITEDNKEYEECPECHEKSLIREGGCKQCLSCGYSKCE